MALSDNRTKALVKTKREPKGALYVITMLFRLVKEK